MEGPFPLKLQDDFVEGCKQIGGTFSEEGGLLTCVLGDRKLWIQDNGWAKSRDTEGSRHSMGAIKDPSYVIYKEDVPFYGVDKLQVVNEDGENVMLIKEL